ncbi:hypothetical protein NX059_004278 [Plenodomus lindquistii]|nr:hypothetical protein NX059_004278 [Plenodomus lindquistii]
MPHFASQLRSEQHTTPSLRASHYGKKRKARRDHEQLEASSASPTPEPQATSNALPEIAQLRLAGLLPEQDDRVPAAPFPHAPAKPPRTHYDYAKAHQDMATLPSPLYAVHAEPDIRSVHGQRATAALRQTHLDVLSTLMHTCLLAGDYDRAGRAWGIILRTQVAGGHPVDPRNNGRWGIGAEILLRRNPQTPSMQNGQGLDSSRASGDDVFSEHGFERAREYYERLIVQHPHRRFAPTATDERTFYPAMFSLWILEVRSKSERARTRLRDQAAERPGKSRSVSADSVLGPDTHHLDASEEAVRGEELARAMEIAERLDRLVESPPFDKQVSLLQLRGHVSLWLSDLITGGLSLDEDQYMDSSFDESNAHNLPTREELTRLIDGQRELRLAQSFLRRAETIGAQAQASTMASIDMKLRAIARRLEEPDDQRDETSTFLTADETTIESL